MKEKVNRAKEWVKSKWKKLFENIPVAILIICFVLLVALPVLALQDSINESKKNMATVENTDKKNEKEDSNTKNDSDSDKKKKEAASDQEKKEDDEKTKSTDNAGEQQTTADSSSPSSQTQSQQTQDTSNVGSGSSGNPGSSGGGSDQTYVPPAEPVQPDPPAEEPVHTHSYTIPIQEWQDKYKQEERSICNGCGADITGDPWTHIENQMLAGNMACGGYHSEWIKVPDGQELVTVGWKCSCGATQN